MKLSQIRYFLEVAKYRNITQASKRLYVSQPTITVAIKELEKELEIDLFHREKQRIFLTDDGKFFYEEALQIIEKLDNLIEVVKDKKKESSLKLGVPPMTGAFLFSKLLKGFKSNYPHINLDIYEHGTLKSRELLQEEELDLAITTSSYSKPSNTNFLPILKTSYGFYTSKTDPILKIEEPLDFKDIKEVPLILFNKGFNINQKVIQEFEGIEVKPNIFLETGQIETAKQLISEGLACGFIIKECIKDSDGLIEVPFKNSMSVYIGMEWKRKKYQNSSMKSFIEYLRKNYELYNL